MFLHDDASFYADFGQKSGFPSLRDLLKSKFPGISQRKIALKLGVDNATVARWMSVQEVQPTSMEKCLRIARACHVDPREVFAMVGLLEDFGPLWDYYHGRVPTILQFYPSDAGRGRLMERADQLLRRGWERRFEAKLKELESYWEVNRSAFEALAKSLDVEAAFLLMKHPGSDSDILYSFGCTPAEARRELGSEEQVWEHFEHSKGALELHLHLKQPSHLEPTVIEVILAGWHASFRTLFSAD